MTKLALAALVLAAWPAAARADWRQFGIMADAGAPEGAQVAVVIRPVRALRLHGGAGYNGISSGVHAGASLVPFASWVSPTLDVDYGSFPEGDATHLVRVASGDPAIGSPLLRKVGYRFANARVGLEFGRKRVTFYLHAGASRITGTVRDFGAVLDDPHVMITTTPPRIDAWTVSARVGLIVYFGP